jgi:hypothetical protein
MWLLTLCLAGAMVGLLAGCGASEAPSGGEGAEGAGRKLTHPVQEDLQRFMPRENRQAVTLLEGNLFDNENLPAATVADYRKGNKEYQQFLFKAQNTAMAGVYLGYCKDAMTTSKFIAGFGGYYGEINGKPVFAFVKNEYVTGLVGLSQEEADAEGRLIAARIP